LEGRIEVAGTKGRRRKQLLGELIEKRGYWKVKDVTLDLPKCRTCFAICQTDYELNCM
jgi:hypothetical protein